MVLLTANGGGLVAPVVAVAPAPVAPVVVVTGEVAPVAPPPTVQLVTTLPPEILPPPPPPPPDLPPPLPAASSAGLACAATSSAPGFWPPAPPWDETALRKRGYVRFQEWMPDGALWAHPMNRLENAYCSLGVRKDNPWVDVFLGAVLDLKDPCAAKKVESPCMVGWGHPSYKVWTIEEGAARGTRLPDLVSGPTPPDNPYAGWSPCDPTSSACYGGDPGSATGGLTGGSGVGGILSSIGGDLGALLQVLGLGKGVASDIALVRAVLAVVLAAGKVGDSVAGLPEGVGARLGAHLDSLGTAFSSNAGAIGGLGQSLDSTLLDGFLPRLGDLLPPVLGPLVNAATSLGDATLNGASGPLVAFVASAEPVIAGVAAAVKKVLGPMIADVEKLVQTFMANGLKLFTDRIEKFGAPVGGAVTVGIDPSKAWSLPGNVVTPDTVYQLAGDVLADAVVAGTAAQGGAALLELIHPLKNMGLAQFVGFIASFAGFDEIIKPYLDPTLHYALNVPARQHAAWKWQTELPDARRAKELAASGLLLTDDYASTLRFHGFPTWYIAKELDDLYHHLRPTDLARALDASEADAAWLVAKLRRFGLSPDDAAILGKALELKATQPGRTKLATAAFDAFKKGQIDDAQLEDALTGADLSATHRSYWRKAATLERRGVVMEKVAADVLTQYRNGLVSRLEAAQELHALGFTDADVTLRVLVTDLQRLEVQLKADARTLTQALHAAQVQGQKDVTRQLKAGLITDDQFVSYMVAFGYSPTYAQAAADVAHLGPPIKPNAGEALVGLDALEATRKQIAGYMAQQVTTGVVDKLAALAILVELGMPSDLASILVDVASVLAGQSPAAAALGIPGAVSLGSGFATIAGAIVRALESGQPLVAVLDSIFGALGIRGLARQELDALVRELGGILRGL
jgi:hypothetical protein